MNQILPSLMAYLVQVPVILVWLTGIVLAIVFWKRQPRVALLAVIAFAGFLVMNVINTYLNLWLPLTLQRQGMQLSMIATLQTVRGILSSLASAALWALIVAAIFGWRKENQAPQE
jgi:hypothetical protein